jgi:hypothetical protein
MSLTAADFKRLPILTITEEPCFKHVRGEYVPRDKVEKKLPPKVVDLVEKQRGKGRDPNAWILDVRRRNETAYAVVAEDKAGINHVRVVDKHGETILKYKQESFDSTDD